MTQTGYSVATLAELRLIGPADRVDLFVIFVGEKNAWYRCNPTMTGVDDGDRNIKPVQGVGMWRMVRGDADGSGSNGGSGGSDSGLSDRVDALETNVSDLQASTASDYYFLSDRLDAAENEIQDRAYASDLNGIYTRLNDADSEILSIGQGLVQAGVNLNSRANAIETRTRFVLRRLVDRIRSAFLVGATYDSNANESYCSVNGSITGFVGLFRVSEVISQTGAPVAFTVQYFDANNVATYGTNTTSAKLTFSGNLGGQTLYVFVDRYPSSSTDFVDALYTGL